MDEELAVLSERVAAAADAWLADPQDVRVYGHLVRAVHERRTHLHPPLASQGSEPEVETTPPQPLGPTTGAGADEILHDLDDAGPVRSLGAFLVGADPRDVLDRLRRSSR